MSEEEKVVGRFMSVKEQMDLIRFGPEQYQQALAYVNKPILSDQGIERLYRVYVTKESSKGIKA